MKKYLILILSLFFTVGTFAQKTIDEIEIEIKKSKEDENKVMLLTAAGLAYLDKGDSVSARKYADSGMQLALSLKDNGALASAYFLFGKLYYYENLNGEAIKNYKKATEYYSEENILEGLANSFNGLANSYKELYDFENSIENFMKVVSIYEDLGDVKSLATANASLAQIYVLQDNVEQAMVYYQKALTIFEKEKDLTNTTVTLDKIGDILVQQAEAATNEDVREEKLKNVLDIFKKCLTLATDNKDKKNMALAYLKMGRVYYLMNDPMEVFVNYHEATNLYKELSDLSGLTHIYVYTGELYFQLDEFDNAEKELVSAYRFLESGKVNAPDLMVKVCKTLSDVYVATEQYKEAIVFMELYKRSSDNLRNNENIRKITSIQSKYQLERQAKEHESAMKTQRIITWFTTIAFIMMLALAFVVYRSFKTKQRDNKLLAAQKEELQQQKEEILTTTEQLEITNKELEKLSVVASQTDNAVSIMDEEGNYVWINDGFTNVHGYTLDQLIEEVGTNIINGNTPQEVADIIFRCRENKEAVIYEMNTKSRMGKDLWVQTTLTPISDEIGKIKTLIAVESDITKIKEVEQEIMIQRDTLKKTNQRINSSIRYALTIQKAILPLKATLEKHFEAYIFYLPKDIVSGDFYWYSELKDEKNNVEKVFVATVDCTGHGVPGAFMSMIGSRMLNEIVNERKITDPAQILELLNDGIHLALQQDRTDNNDGMDLCLCSYEKISETQRKVVYAGAERPLFLLRQGEAMEIIEGAPKSIGGILSKRDTTPFVSNELILNVGDSIYLSTDGLIDQNNAQGYRFGTKRFTQLMEANRDKSMDGQREKLNAEFVQHVADEEQRDDITVLGLRMK